MKFRLIKIITELNPNQAVMCDCLFDSTETMLCLCIWDLVEDSYVALLDGVALLDAGVLGQNQNLSITNLRAMTKNDYLKAVIWDKPYEQGDAISRGTAWMEATNEFLKQLNKNG